MFLATFEECINDNKTLLKHRKLLETLSDDKVVMVCHDDDVGFYLEECCDEWYSHILTKEECVELSELFREISEVIK